MYSVFVYLNLLTICVAYRHKRYLVYPDGGPARAQFIIGLGVPVDLKEASVTVGTVIKFQYDLPTNSTEYTSRIYGFAETVSRDMASGGNGIEEQNKQEEESSRGKAELEELENENNTLVDINFDDNGARKRRSFLYTEGGLVNEIDNAVAKTELPLQEAIRRQEEINKQNLEVDEEEPSRMNRWDIYKILERMAEGYGYSGRPCLLRTICEAAVVPFTHENGLLAEIAHILFTPSTTKDQLSHHADNEYHAAERLGRELDTDCETLFPECEGSVLETFTEIGEETLHRFGLA